MEKNTHLWSRGHCNCLYKCVNVEIFPEATHSSHESHHVGRTVVQLTRDIELILISLRDTEFKLPFSRNMVNFQDNMSKWG